MEGFNPVVVDLSATRRPQRSFFNSQLHSPSSFKANIQKGFISLVCFEHMFSFIFFIRFYNINFLKADHDLLCYSLILRKAD